MNHCIYVLEDNREIRELIEFLLIKSGYKVSSFESAAAFNAGMHGSHPDFIILDVMLPDGNGIVICEGLKSDEKTKNIPVMLMSANARMDNVARSGAEDFIAKPFDIDNFMNRISKHLAA
jgi:DNA-binding response OmpR family regulator